MKCVVCGEQRAHPREYRISGQRVVFWFSECLHTPEEVAAARRREAAREAGSGGSGAGGMKRGLES
jgi:hypothetical protein